MSQMFRTTLRLDLDKPASRQAAALLRQLDRTCRTVRLLGVYTK